ncbi:MAG: hypothetical protein L0312_10805, partial [Acidobacteria bacterium]|nr:hypothetical protein [Acidobacteriota bacterium]
MPWVLPILKRVAAASCRCKTCAGSRFHYELWHASGTGVAIVPLAGSGLDGQTPLERWASHADEVRFPKPHLDLDDLFLCEVKRKVQKDGPYPSDVLTTYGVQSYCALPLETMRGTLG